MEVENQQNLTHVVDISISCQNLISGIQAFVRYYMPFIVVTGLLGNFLSALTFMATKLRKIPSSHYLTALAFADSGMLLCHVLLMSGGYPSIPGLCQITFYSGSVFSFLSVWYVVSFTLERYIAVRYPLRRLRWCTVKRAKATVCFVAASACIFNSHILISVESKTIENITYCDVRDGFTDVATMMNHIDTAITFAIPMILILVWNAAIASASLFSRQRFSLRKASANNLSVRNASDVAAAVLLSATTEETLLGGASRRYVRRKLTDDRKITRMLLLVSLVFLLMNFPDHVIRMVVHGLYRTKTWATMSNVDQCWILLAQKTSTILFNTNFAVNFFLYSLAGANFRKHLKKLFCRIMQSIFYKFESPSVCQTQLCWPRLFARYSYRDIGPGSRLASGSNDNHLSTVTRGSTYRKSSNGSVTKSVWDSHLGVISPRLTSNRRNIERMNVGVAAVKTDDLALGYESKDNYLNVSTDMYRSTHL